MDALQDPEAQATIIDDPEDTEPQRVVQITYVPGSIGQGLYHAMALHFLKEERAWVPSSPN
jgi:hypothetical protein